MHTLVTRYHDLASSGVTTTQLEATIYETPDASKEALNLLTLIAELYNAGVVGSGLIYDLIRGFLASGTEEEVMAEREVEALLKVLRCERIPVTLEALTKRLRTTASFRRSCKSEGHRRGRARQDQGQGEDLDVSLRATRSGSY